MNYGGLGQNECTKMPLDISKMELSQEFSNDKLTPRKLLLIEKGEYNAKRVYGNKCHVIRSTILDMNNEGSYIRSMDWEQVKLFLSF